MLQRHALLLSSVYLKSIYSRPLDCPRMGNTNATKGHPDHRTFSPDLSSCSGREFSPRVSDDGSYEGKNKLLLSQHSNDYSEGDDDFRVCI